MCEWANILVLHSKQNYDNWVGHGGVMHKSERSNISRELIWMNLLGIT